MDTTRRTLLRSAGVAAAGSMLFQPAASARGSAAPAPAPASTRADTTGLRGQAYCTLRTPQGDTLGVRRDDKVLDVGKAGKALKVPVPASTDEVVEGKALPGLQKVLAASPSAVRSALVPLAEARFGPCITRPQKIIMLGFNYRKHAQETGTPIPKAPVLFNKYNNALLGHEGTIKLPTKVAKKFDYEVELQVIIGKQAKDVSEAEALGYVFGYATGNDFSARDLQFRDAPRASQFMIGKTSDGFMPVGPWLVGADLVGDPQNLKLETRVNGEQRQSSNTNDMIFTCAQIIAYASSIFSLAPGDLISTGTPEGVIVGKPEAQQVWLKPGDRVECSVEKCGELRFSLT
ncbi:MAG TPA: fumarylacetoacetate hydrolase family protein [Myxococcaceae bacterium]|nr:fumarylacetoacetate hydrolase family protein [Myxococcaceae bacterium]